MDEGNIAAETGVKDGVIYVKKNTTGTVIAKQLIALEDSKPFQATEKSILKYLNLYFFNSEKLSSQSPKTQSQDQKDLGWH